MNPKISIFLICKNEERIIEKTLKQAAKLADEIIIVDSGSTDSTLEISSKYTDKIFHQDWLGFGKQKNIALNYCSNEWVLSLDSDEVLSDDLIQEIKDLYLPIFASDNNLSLNPNAFLIARKLFIGEAQVRFGGFYPDYQLRLFRKSKGRFSDSPVHESVELLLNGEYSKDRTGIKKLKKPLYHYAYSDLNDLENSFSKYAQLSTKKKNPLKGFLSGIYTAFYKYFIRLGFLDGLLGIRLALVSFKYQIQKYS